MPWTSICSWPESSSHVRILIVSSQCQFGVFCLVGFCVLAYCRCNLPVFLQDSLGEQGSHRLLGTECQGLCREASRSTPPHAALRNPVGLQGTFQGKPRGSGTRNSSYPKGTNAQNPSHPK